MTTDRTESKHLTSLKEKLREMFQLDQADLDFGIYRIMNAKRDEVERFLDDDLLPQVQEALADYQPAELVEKRQKLEAAIAGAAAAGIDPETAPNVKQLRAELEDAVDVGKLEEEIYSHLTTFFSRYYHGGDFMSLRRYKEGVYALPYEGEEVKIHWANADQYYIKSSESFQSYAVKTAKGRVRFDLVSAGVERDNVKAAAGKERRFILDQDTPLAMDADELIVRFQYRSDEDKRNQKNLNIEAVETILSLAGDAPALTDIADWAAWKDALSAKAPTKKNADRTILEKHLTNYTAKNSFDYFIHKNLGRFLRQELDFFIKNEVMYLDDIESDTVARVEQYLSKIKVLRAIAHKFIDFLAQLEDFQKKLWLKKKFVLETNWLVTLDKVPEDLYPQITANHAQRAEWVKLFAIDEIKSDLGGGEDYAEPLSIEFLRANPFLVLDTTFFDDDFKDELLVSFEDIDEEAGGLLTYGDNFHGMNLVCEQYKNRIKCVYLDPPYNTAVSAIPYKNNYQHSTWLTMMRDRLSLIHPTLIDASACYVSIDKHERSSLETALDETFGKENKIEELIWVQNTNDGRSPTFSTNHEYIEVYSRSKEAAENDFMMFREPKPGFSEIMDTVNIFEQSYPPISEIVNELSRLFGEHRSRYKEEVVRQGLNWETEKRNDLWKGTYPYKFAEYRAKNGNYVPEELAKEQKARIWIFRESDWTIMESDRKQSATTKDPNHPNYRYYQPTHPLTGKPCSMPSRGWKGTQFIDPKYPLRNSCESLVADHRIAFGDNESKVPQQKRFLHEVDTNVSKSIIVDYSDGEKETTALFGEKGVFLAPKHTSFVERFVQQSTSHDSIVLDIFGGSGSTAGAVMNSNRLDGGSRKFILMETNQYFYSTILPRVKKTTYSSGWKNGKPVSRDGVPLLTKYFTLESYEDCLDNLTLSRTADQQKLVDEHDRFREDYMLGYMLDVEAKGSLLDLSAFADPFGYKLSVVRDDERKNVSVDLVETFNYLLGLRVKTRERVRGVLEITGTNPEGEKIIILWRNVADKDNNALDDWFKKRGYNARDMEFDLIYVNGDNNIENLRRTDETWKVRLTEQAFHTLMFDVEDV